MGFFKDFKNDMKQAVNELIPDNEEMVNEYDDEDMVNTLEAGTQPEDEEYVNTMTEEPSKEPATEDDILDEVDLSDLEEFDLEEEDMEDTLHSQSTPEEFAKSVLNTIRTESAGASEDASASDMDALAELLSESADKEAPAAEPEEASKEKPAAGAGKENKKPEQKKKQPKQEPKKAEAAKPVKKETEDKKEVKGQKEETAMAEEKIIEITTVKETEEASKSPEEAAVPSTPDDSTTYITKGTRIEGNLFTEGSIDVIGTVDGDVNCYGKLVISGVVNGKVNASEIYANAARINGEVLSAGSVKIGVGSVIVGNIEAQSAVVAGAVNGDLDVKGPVIVDSTAVIMGNIKSRSVQINNGAVIEGFCSQCYSDIDVKSFFA